VSNTQFQAGQYQLVSVYLSNYDRSSKIEISQLISGFSINESMSTPFMSGSTTVFDGQDILSRLPVIGEEFIEFKYTDFFGQTRTDMFLVYSVSDVKYPDESNPTLIQYTLNFVSIPRVLSDSNRIMKSYKDDVISTYVKSVFDDVYMKPLKDKQLKTKVLHCDTTTNIINLVIPNYTPTETFLFFARHAFKSESKTQTFRFFENRDAYFFGTNEYVRDWYGIDGVSSTTGYYDQSQGLTLPNAHIYSYNYLPNLGPENQTAIMSNVISFDFGEKVNSINDIKYGAYKKRISEINILNGTAQTIPVYSIQDDYKEKNVKLAHSNNFINDTMTDKHLRFVIKDYSGAGDPSGPAVRNDMNYMELYTRKTSYFYHYNQNTFEATIYGKNAIVAGSVINLQIPLRKRVDSTRSAGAEIDLERSGYYIVNEIKNVFQNKTYTQNLKISRYGIGTK